MNFLQKISLLAAFALLACFAAGAAQAQDLPEIKYKSLDQKLPVDPAVTIGSLDNGMKYYIRENHKPENRAELQIVFKAGSILEDDDQAGLAHFLEHMCFNGTKNFPKMELVNFLESTGMKFGADVNANTGFERTYYMITIPLDKEGLLDKGFQVLSDWARNVSLKPEDIEQERGVIMEEWRVYQGANMRILYKHLPKMLKGSKYAKRMPIGDTAVIQHAPREAFMRFYKDWYRPNLTAVVAVGDFDKKEIEKKIIDVFSDWENPKNMKERKSYDVPSYDEPIVSIAKDPELRFNSVEVMFKHPPREAGTFADYKQGLTDQMVSIMLSMRLAEKTREADPPYLQAYAQESDFWVGDIRAFTLSGYLATSGFKTGAEALLTEAFRAYQHGFTQTELDRVKELLMTSIEKAYAEREKTESDRYAREYYRNFIDEEGIPGIAYEYALFKKFIPEITIQDANNLIRKLIRMKDLVVAVSAVDKPGVEVPDEKEMLAMIDEVSKKKLEPYADEVSDAPLFNKQVKAGKVVDTKKSAPLGLTEYKLANGARIILKPTDFKNDEILFRAYSFGGSSLADDKIFRSASVADDLIDEAGISEFNATALQKKLAGKTIQIAPYIGELTEGLSGSSSPKDLETFMQLLHLYFSNPRKDDDAYKSYVSKMKEVIANSKRDPRSAFRDTISYVMANYDKREKPWTEECVEKIDYDAAFEFYTQRFADASDFTFIFVGAIDVDEIKPMIEKYIGSLPGKNSAEKFVDLKIRPPKGKLKKIIKKGIEKQSSVGAIITGDFEYTPQNRFDLQSMVMYFNIRLREEVREEKGGTYGIYSFARPNQFPVPHYRLDIYFNTNPDRVEELLGTVKEVIKELKTEIKPEIVAKVQEQQKRQYETDLKENRFWLNALYQYNYNDEEPEKILEFTKLSENLKASDIKAAAKKYLNDDNMAIFIQYPEDYDAK